MIYKIARFLFIVFLSLLSLYLALVSGTSLYIGFTNTHRVGFWMPILCGILVLILTGFLIRLIVYLIKKARSRDKYLYI
jgi:hypothetical protein